MSHLSHDDLLLLYYGEPGADRTHLSACNECADAFARLSSEMDRIPAFDVPEPDADYEQQTWHRLHWRLGVRRQSRRFPVWIAVAATLATALIGALLWFRRPTVAPSQPQKPQQVASTTEAQRDRVLLVFVSDHFEESERMLVELTNLTPDAHTDISSEQTRAQDLLASNRMYRRTALDRGEENVATLLDELEPVLIEIAHASSQPDASELRAIQHRVEAKGLVFKLRVVRAGVRADQRTQPLQPNV